MAGERERACDAGVFLLSPEQRDKVTRQDAILAGEIPIVLAGAEVSGREEFFTAIAKAIPFPDYFGRNWDAVYDCLTDPSVMPANGTILMLDGFDHMAIREPEQWAIALKVLRDACDFWRPLSLDLTVLLVGPPELAPGVRLLPSRCLYM